MRGIRLIAMAVAAVAATTLHPSAAGGAGPVYAPVNRPGPSLDVPEAQLDGGLSCTADLASARTSPVLFIPPTLVNPDEAYAAYEAYLRSTGVPYCAVTIPFFTTEDIQISAEYVVYAVRKMHALTDRQVQLVGWSQGGGPEPRWALRFWPDIRPMVSKLVDLEAPNHGTIVIHDACADVIGVCASDLCPGHCTPAIWQQADDSRFSAALNSGQETFPGIAYTNIYSHVSQFVQPNLDSTGTTSLHGGGGWISNIATQDVCPANAADHLAYWYDPVGFALVVDALTHSDPADPSRVNRSVCTQATNPYVPVSEVPVYNAYLYDAIFVNRFYQEPQTPREPALRCYVTASC